MENKELKKELEKMLTPPLDEKESQLICLCGKSGVGKTVSAGTFPKPMLFLDMDDGFKSIKAAKDVKGNLIVPDWEQIRVEKFFKDKVYDLNFNLTSGAPAYTAESGTIMAKYNTIIRALNSDEGYEGVHYKTLVIDNGTEMFNVWCDRLMQLNSISVLRIQDYMTLGGLLRQFISSLKSLIINKKLQYIILINHTDSDKDEITGMIEEFPVAPTKQLGRKFGRSFDEIWLQVIDGKEYAWKTRKSGLFYAKSRLHMPEVVKPATYQELVKYVK